MLISRGYHILIEHPKIEKGFGKYYEKWTRVSEVMHIASKSQEPKYWTPSRKSEVKGLPSYHNQNVPIENTAQPVNKMHA